jgi:hypothetical protein
MIEKTSEEANAHAPAPKRRWAELNKYQVRQTQVKKL